MLLPKMGKRIFTALVIVLLFFSTITPFNNPVSSAQGHEAIKRQAVVQGEFNKINKTLLAEFKEKEQVTFLVKFKEKADVKQVAQNAEKKAVARKVTPYQKELMVRSTVISELKATAAKSQEHVLEFLDKMVQEGKAKDVKSFFIVNAVAVTATKDVMEKLATFPEVEKILPNEERHLLPSSPERLGGALHNEIANTAWGIERIGAPEVWQMGINGSGIVVAAIDTGVEWDHPALKEKYRGYNPETGEVDHEFAWYDTAYDMTSRMMMKAMAHT
ncbi:MAG: protease inhibitor I9 family protein [Caldibacillus sp.]